GIAALADREIGVLLPQVHLPVERGDGRGPDRLALPWQWPAPVAADAAQHRIERGDVRRLGAAATPDHVDPVLEDKALEPLLELAWTERIMGAPGDELGQT